VIASGGVGRPEHVREAIAYGKADAVAVAHVLHFHKFTMREIKRHLEDSGLPVRGAPDPLPRAS
jgi:cyclase